MARQRPKANASQTLAHFLWYLRKSHKDVHGKTLSQGQLALDLGYRSAGVISELEDPEKCRATYEHLERYADHFSVPAGVMLLITRITSAAKYGAQDGSSTTEIDDLRRGIEAILKRLDEIKASTGAVFALLHDENSLQPSAWDSVFEELLLAFHTAVPATSPLRDGSSHRVRVTSPTKKKGSPESEPSKN